MFNDFPQTFIIGQVCVNRLSGNCQNYCLFQEHIQSKWGKHRFCLKKKEKKRKSWTILQEICPYLCALSIIIEVYLRRLAWMAWFILISHDIQYYTAHKTFNSLIIFLLHTIIFCKQVFTVTMHKREGEKTKNSLDFSVGY